MRAFFFILVITLSAISCSAGGHWEYSDPLQEDFYDPGLVKTHDYFGPVRTRHPDILLSLKAEEGWYRGAQFYHIWVKSFRDASTGPLSGDKIGDLIGVREALEEGYFDALGVDALWLSPIFATAGESSPYGNMHGYDATNYYKLNSYFGQISDLEDLIRAAHGRGILLIFDFVPNHLSSQHPWFVASSDPQHPEHHRYKDWFIWSKDFPQEFKNWNDAPTFHYHPKREAYYYGLFNRDMPDLNFRHPQVRTAIANFMTYWLNLGFDGIRVDAIGALFEDPVGQGIARSDLPETREFYAELRELLDEYERYGYAKAMVAENWSFGRSKLDQYGDYEGRASFHMSFSFDFAADVYQAVTWGNGRLIKDFYQKDLPRKLTAARFITNHDNMNSRPMSAFDSSAKARLAAALNILGPGPAFVYYGNEIGMPGVKGSDVALRRALDWDEVGGQTQDSESLLSWYRTLGSLRRQYSSVFRGYDGLSFVPSTQQSLLIYQLTGEGQTLTLAFNLGSEDLDFSPWYSEGYGQEILVHQGSNPRIIPPYGTLVFAQEIVEGATWGFDQRRDRPASPFTYAEVYLRGTIGLASWDLGQRMLPLGDNRFFIDLNLSSREYRFKFTEDQTIWGIEWNGNNLAIDDSQLKGGEIQSLPEDYHNLYLTMQKGGQTRFLLDIDAQTLTISSLGP
jgi:alpha-amylase